MSHSSGRRPAPPGRLRQKLHDDVRRSLLAGAAALLDRGDHDFSVQALAEEVECSVGTIYRYFRSKDAVIDAVRADQLRALLAGLTQQGADLDARLAAAELSGGAAPLGGVIGRLRDVHHACLADASLLAAAHRSLLTPEPAPDDPRSPSAREAVELVHHIAAALDAATEHGALRPFSSNGLAVAIIVCITAVSLTAAAGHLAEADAAWVGREWSLAALRVSGADPTTVQVAASLAWPLPPEGP